MKKTLKQLNKEYDFKNPNGYFDYCIESHINGQFKQCRDLFNAMSKNDKKCLIVYIGSMELESVYNFYFNIL
mgnify:CR=1 FL=1